MSEPRTPVVTPEATHLFEEAARLQGEFWDALNALENELGIEIDGTDDLGATTLEDLIAGEEEDEDE